MSANPFTANSAIRLRCQEITGRRGAILIEEASHCLASSNHQAQSSGVLTPVDCDRLIAGHELAGVEELMLQLLPLAKRFARPVISQFHVGVIGLERETGNLLFGGNMEFPGTHMGLTIHGETCLAARAFSRGTSLASIALTEAHPCGHCRQFLSEFASAPDLRLIDPHGHVLTLADLLPWPFDPAYLGEPGARADKIAWPDLAIDGKSGLFELLLETGRKAHAPYTKNPAAVVCVMRDGRLFAGASIESVAYNPSMGPLQVAIINITASGYDGGDVAEIHLAERQGAATVHADQVRLMGASYAADATVTIHHWR